MSTSSAPDSSDRIPVSELTVKLANADQGGQLLRAIVEYPLWGGGMSYETFSAMDDRSEEEGEWTANQGALCWALVRRDDPEGEILTACETHRTACLIRKANSTEVEDGWCYGVTVVITPPQHRGNGYGKHFMRLLHYIFASPSDLPPFPPEWGAPPSISPEVRKAMPYGVASYLASEIGPSYYAQCTRGLDLPGWIARPEDQGSLTWDLHKRPPAAGKSPAEDLPGGWKAVYEADLPRVAAALSESARGRMRDLPPSDEVRILPDPASPGILTFAHRFGSFMPLPSWYSSIDPMPIGLQLQCDDGRVATCMLAMYNFQLGRKCNITLIHDVLAEELESLLEALDQLMSPTDYTQGWVWGLPEDKPIVQKWLGLPGRNTEVTIREKSNLMADVVYIGEGHMVFKQMWTWL